MVAFPESPKEARLEAEGSFWWFCCNVMGFKDLYEPLHRKICDFIQQIEGRPEKYTSLLIPRGHFKTTLGSIAYTIWRLLRDPNLRILIVHGKREQSVSMLREVKYHLENNDVIRELWAHVVWSEPSKDAPIWLKDKIVVRRSREDKVPSVIASSVDSSVVGLHFDFIIHDDLVYAENVTTEEQRENVKQYRRESEALQRTEDCKILNIGTRWHEDDAHGELTDSRGPYGLVDGRPQVRSMVLKATADETVSEWMGVDIGEPIFKTRYTVERLDGLKQRMGEYAYSCQFENDPRPDLLRIFDRKHLKWFVPNPDGSPPCVGNFRYFSALDPNRSEKETADYCVLITAAVDEDGHIWIVDMRRGHPSGPEIVDWVRECAERWEPEQVIVEAQNFQLQLCKWLQEDQLKSGVHYRILQVERSRKNRKFERICAMQPLIVAGGLHVRQTPWADDLARELDMYGPRAKNDDILDALADIYAYGTKAKPEKKEEEVPKSPFLMNAILEDLYTHSDVGAGERVRLGRAY